MNRPKTTEPPAAAPETGDPAGSATQRIRRGPQLIIAVVAALGSATIYLAPLPAELRESIPFGILFALLGCAQLGAVGAVLAKATVRNLLLAGGVAGTVVVFRALALIDGLFTPDPWRPVDSVIGFTDAICAGLAGLAVVILGVLALRGPRPAGSVSRRVSCRRVFGQ